MILIPHSISTQTLLLLCFHLAELEPRDRQSVASNNVSPNVTPKKRSREPSGAYPPVAPQQSSDLPSHGHNGKKSSRLSLDSKIPTRSNRTARRSPPLLRQRRATETDARTKVDQAWNNSECNGGVTNYNGWIPLLCHGQSSFSSQGAPATQVDGPSTQVDEPSTEVDRSSSQDTQASHAPSDPNDEGWPYGSDFDRVQSQLLFASHWGEEGSATLEHFPPAVRVDPPSPPDPASGSVSDQPQPQLPPASNLGAEGSATSEDFPPTEPVDPPSPNDPAYGSDPDQFGVCERGGDDSHLRELHGRERDDLQVLYFDNIPEDLENRQAWQRASLQLWQDYASRHAPPNARDEVRLAAMRRHLRRVRARVQARTNGSSQEPMSPELARYVLGAIWNDIGVPHTALDAQLETMVVQIEGWDARLLIVPRVRRTTLEVRLMLIRMID